jgi:hypothetical protein
MRLFSALAALLASASVTAADLLPPVPKAPDGAREAVIRGVAIERFLRRSRDPSWAVAILRCPSEQPACVAHKLVECLITGANGRPIADGDVAAIIAADAASGTAPLRLDLSNCPTATTELSR